MKRMNVVALATIMLGVSSIVLLAVLLLVMSGCANSESQQPTVQKYDQEFHYVHDWAEPKEPSGIVRIMQEQAAKQAQSEQETAQPVDNSEADYLAESEYYDDYSASYSGSYSGDGFMQQGVRAGVDSATETWYSSNALYHYRTSEWTADAEGYYRDSEGYYVVSSNDYAQGSVVNTSKGAGKVYDDGTASGNIDMYVNW